MSDAMLRQLGWLLGQYASNVLIRDGVDPGELAKFIDDAVAKDIKAQQDVISGRRRFRLQAWLWMNTALVLLLAGCVERPEATHEPMTAADGQRAMLVSCPRSRGECLAEAASICPNGYRVLDEESQQTLKSTPNATAFSAYNGHLVPRTLPGQAYTEYRGEMLVRCRRGEK